MQKNNFINKFYFCPNFFSYRFSPNFKKLCGFNKLQITFSRKRFPTTFYQIQQFVYKNFFLENVFLIVSAIKEFIFKNQKR